MEIESSCLESFEEQIQQLQIFQDKHSQGCTSLALHRVFHVFHGDSQLNWLIQIKIQNHEPSPSDSPQPTCQDRVALLRASKQWVRSPICQFDQLIRWNGDRKKTFKKRHI
jgi:hypothetical protein